MNLSDPKISIIIPNYNRGDLISETLDSVLSQDYGIWEAIVVDDGSTDNSELVVNEYAKKDNRILFFSRNRNPGGAPVCRNIGLDKSSGDYVIFLDSDDLLADFCLSQRVKMIRENPDKDLWVFPMWVFSKIPGKAAYLWNIENSSSDISRFLSLDAVWQTSGPIWKKSSVQKIEGFTEGLACWQDVDIHLKALGNHLAYEKYYSLPPDVFYRQHAVGSISQGEISSLPKLKARLQILKNHFNYITNKDADIIKGFQIMAENIAIGSARTLHKHITREVLDFGRKNNLFEFSFVLKTKLMQTLVISRLNRVPAINKYLLRRIKKYQHDSNIGKHSFHKTADD